MSFLQEVATISSTMNNVTLSYSLNETSTHVLQGAEQYGRYKIAKWLDTYSTYILTAVALFGNSAAFFTVCSMKPITSTSLYITALAVVDTMCLVFKLLVTNVVGYTSIPEAFSCGFLLCVFFCVQYFSSYLILAISVERYVAVWFPLKVNQIFTRRVAQMSLLFMFLCFLPLSMWTFWTYERIEHQSWGVICVTKWQYLPMVAVFRKIHPIIYVIIPFILIMALNTFIIVGLRRSIRLRRRVSRSGSATGNGDGPSRAANRLSIMLVTTAFAFLLLELPIVCLGIFKNYGSSSTRDFVQDYFFVELAQTLEDMNHTINFFLYFLVGTKFRKRFMDLFVFGKCRRKSRHRRISLSINYSTRISQTGDSISTQIPLTMYQSQKLNAV